MIIYKTTNKINNKSYIGQTIKSLNERISTHLYYVNDGSNYLFHKAIRKYGKENFIWEIICECNSKKELNEKEKFYIKFYNTKTPKGYNLTDGGEGMVGWHHTEKTKRIMSENNSGENNPMFGKKRPDMCGDNNPNRKNPPVGVLNSMYGKKRPDTIKRNEDNNPMKDPKAREKNSKSHIGQIPWNKGISYDIWIKGK